MKSPMVTNAPYIEAAQKSGYSDLKVMSSAAGYYVGTSYINVEANGETWEEPGSRDSDYFRTEAQAAAFLAVLEGTDEATAALVTRQHP